MGRCVVLVLKSLGAGVGHSGKQQIARSARPSGSTSFSQRLGDVGVQGPVPQGSFNGQERRRIAGLRSSRENLLLIFHCSAWYQYLAGRMFATRYR